MPGPQGVPPRRSDESFSITVRFSASGTEAATAALAAISHWIQQNDIGSNSRFDRDFQGAPRVSQDGPLRVDVTFDARPRSECWKDWIVSFVQTVRQSSHGLAFDGFADPGDGR